MTQKTKIAVMRSGKDITVVLNGTSFYINEEDKESAVELYKSILAFKEDGSDEAIKKMTTLISPGYRTVIDLGGKLQKDRLGNYYLGNYSIALPMKLLTVMKENVENDIPLGGLENFWKLLMLNPDIHVRDSLFRFMDRFKMPVTDNGYFIAYKSVAWKGEADKALGVFASQKYVAKKSAGRSTEGFLVVEVDTDNFLLKTEKEHETELAALFESHSEEVRIASAIEWMVENKKFQWLPIEGKVTPEEALEFAISIGFGGISDDAIMAVIIERMGLKVHGTLEDLFKGVSDMFDYESPTFTDWHTKKSTIELGEPVKMPREECDNNPDNTCSSGLHVGAPGYVTGFGWGEERHIIACLVNPMNVVAIPEDYNFEKMRTCEYLPYAICEMEDGDIVESQSNYFEEDYINYEEKLLKDTLGELDLNNEADQERERIIKDRLVDLTGASSHSIVDESDQDDVEGEF